MPFVTVKQVSVRAQPIDVSDHTRVFKGDDCIVNKEAGSVRGVEDMVVCVLRTSASEVRRGEGAGMKWHRVNWGTLFSYTFNTCLIFNNFEGDVGGCLCLPLLVDKDEGILASVGGVELLPTLTQMLGVLHDDLWFIRREGVRFRPRGDAVKEGDCRRDR